MSDIYHQDEGLSPELAGKPLPGQVEWRTFQANTQGQTMTVNSTFTSESVSEGHPDKMADQISDAILDAIISEDKDARVACETMVKTGMVILAGEITTEAWVDLEDICRTVVLDIGYNSSEVGFDGASCAIINAIGKQSPDIAMGVDEGENKEQGAGDRPDAKRQISFRYATDGNPVAIDAVVLSTQHSPDVSLKDLQEAVMEEIIKPVLPENWLHSDTKYFINPTGNFVIGGPVGDCGLTGRKIIVDTYGGMARHGGGAFSGKDPSKVDRSAAYAGRYVAKNIVAAGLAKRCEIQLSYAIGVAEPTSISVNTFGTGVIDETAIEALVREHFELRPKGLVEMLDLKRPIYRKTAAYGHFGREDKDFTWEATDKKDLLAAAK